MNIPLPSADEVQSVIAAAAVLISAVVTWRKARQDNFTGAAERVEKHMQDQDERMDKLERRLEEAQVRERIRDDYIALLRMHIADGNPPPPPPWPPALITFHTEKD